MGPTRCNGGGDVWPERPDGITRKLKRGVSSGEVWRRTLNFPRGTEVDSCPGHIEVKGEADHYAIPQELSSGIATLEEPKAADAYGLSHHISSEPSDGDHAYSQALLGGIP